MEVQEFGKQNSRKIMLLPGNMMSWRQFEAVIPLLEKQYHVIAVSTDGYDDTGKTTFTTAEAMAEKLEQYIKEEQDGAIDLVLGESMGGATAGMLFHRQKVKVGAMILSGPRGRPKAAEPVPICGKKYLACYIGKCHQGSPAPVPCDRHFCP